MLLSQRENLGALPPGFSELGFTVFALMGGLVLPHRIHKCGVLGISVPNPAPNQWPLWRTPGHDVQQGLRAEPRADLDGTSLKPSLMLFYI